MIISIVILDKEREGFLMKDETNSLSLDDLFLDDVTFKEKSEEQIILEKYINTFGHGLPIELIPDTISEAEIFQKARICIDNNQDNLLELLEIEINSNDLY